ncbi:hypothetical protein ATB53_05325 [Xanthomonas translucens]|uniref:Uncharacterized protein n=1 Tax=Xanthomonas campestris pv. translucens TaxID=343 RepID=A0A120EW31_XANCT|nr:hypothetical protein ATB53_05325 [Xanthomonas translucens]
MLDGHLGMAGLYISVECGSVHLPLEISADDAPIFSQYICLERDFILRHGASWPIRIFSIGESV